MTDNKDVVRRYIDGFNRSDHEQILSCLTDDIRWTVFGAFRLEGKQAYDAEIENPAFTGSPSITITRMVEEDDVVMAEMAARSAARNGRDHARGDARGFVFRGGKIEQRRAYVVELVENHYK